MLKIIGALLVAGGATAMGLISVSGLTARVKLLSRLVEALGYMRGEISFNLTPLPDIIQSLSAKTGEADKNFFWVCQRGLKKLGDKPFPEIWRESIDSTLGHLLKEEELITFAALGDVLGRYDSEEQVRSLEYAEKRLSLYLQIAETERAQQGKVYGAVSVLSGLAAIIILI